MTANDYKARFYLPRLGRFLSADTLVPGVGSLSINRYMYVKGNAVRHTDPSGHCAPDDDECNALAQKIVQSSNGRITFDWYEFSTKYWTTQELVLLQQALNEYSLSSYLASAHITFKRKTDGGSYVGADTMVEVNGQFQPWSSLKANDDKEYTITIYDFAYKASPDAKHPFMGIYGPWTKSDKNFKGVLAHELTHVVQGQTISATGIDSANLVKEFRADTKNQKLPFKSNYISWALDNAEAMAITVATYQYGNRSELSQPWIDWMYKAMMPTILGGTVKP